MNAIKEEIKIFFTAIMFYTRIPCPSWVDHAADRLNKATRYFPFIGWIVGGASSMAFLVSSQILPISVSVVLSMAAGIAVTGGFHEDGWADVCDGFGGGWTKERILAIMKDSVIGAYGVIGVVLILLLKYLLLYTIAQRGNIIEWTLVVVAAHSTSRLMGVATIYSHDYVRENENSKAKPVAKALSPGNLLLSLIFGIAPLVAFLNYWVFILLVPVFLVKVYMSNYFYKWIGGYTGDCLGAVQQVSEVVFYMSVIVLWKFT